MTPCKLDPILYYLLENKVLTGLSGAYVDDIIRARNEGFRRHTSRTMERFKMAEELGLPFEFIVFSLMRDKDGDFILDQHHYLRKLECLPIRTSFKQFTSMRMRLAWLENSRPDCFFEIAQLAEATEDMFTSQSGAYIRRLNKAVNYLTDIRTVHRSP